MLLIFAKGGLGNQLFQLNALHSAARKGEYCVLIGFDEIPQELNLGSVLRIQVVDKRLRRYAKRASRLFEATLRAVARIGVLASVEFERARYSFTRTRGILPVGVFNEDFFQEIEFKDLHEQFCGRLVQFLQPYPKASLAGMSSTSNAESSRTKCFVHVRRGDFLNWPKGVSTALPAEWFVREMRNVRERFPHTEFVLFSDDYKFLEENFSGHDNWKFAPPADNWVHLRSMMTMPLGILSPSTFSWWAAALHRFHYGGGIFIAPKGWTNWHGKQPEKGDNRLCSFLELSSVG